MNALDQFLKYGFCNLGKITDFNDCAKLLQSVKATREFSSDLFLTEGDYRANPTHKGVNPTHGRNLIEKLDVNFIEKNPAFTQAMEKTLGKNYRIMNKKFVVGVPESWMPEWLLKETAGLAVANLGAYVKPVYRDITYFHGIDFHQDIIDYPNRNSDFVTVYVYLEDTDSTTSPLYVVPGSHRFGATPFPHQIEYKANGLLNYSFGDNSQDYEYFMLTGPGGSVYFWHACLLHGTKPHLHSAPRISIRFLVEKGDSAKTTLIDEVNSTVNGQLSLSQTRIDLDANGVALIRKNTINSENGTK